MRIGLTERFQVGMRGLSSEQRSGVLDAILSLPEALGRPHAHAGLGIRKLHASGIWEARVGLGLRIVFTLAEGALTLVFVGSHDEVKRFLKAL